MNAILKQRQGIETWLLRVPFLHFLFMKIAEPRVVRLGHFVIYLCMIWPGIGLLFSPPGKFEGVLGGVFWVYAIGGFIALGGILCAVAVLPGLWWLERSGIIALITGLLMYIVLIKLLNSSPMGIAIAIAFSVAFAIRWFDIKEFQLAPIEPTKG